MVRTADTPGFAGNRVGFKVLNECAQLAEEHGALLVDKLVGPYTGRALTPLKTIDLVGWDIHRAIVDNIYALAPDEAHETLALPKFMAAMMEKGTLGNKTGRGFFAKSDEGERLALDPRSKRYQPIKEIALPDLGYIDEVARLHHLGLYEQAMAAFAAADGPYAALARKVIAGYISYAFHRVGEVTESIRGVDLIMGYGFNWAPPGVLVDTFGLETTLRILDEAGVPVPALLANADPATRWFDDPYTNTGKFFVAG